MSADLDRYMSSLEFLPAEVQRNLAKLAEMEAKQQVMLRHTDRLAEEYLRGDFPSEEKKNERKLYIESLFAKANRNSENKVKLSYETYEMVDKNIKRLDLYLSRFEEEMEERAAIIAEAPDHHKEVADYSETAGKKKHDRKDKKRKAINNEANHTTDGHSHNTCNSIKVGQSNKSSNQASLKSNTDSTSQIIKPPISKASTSSVIETNNQCIIKSDVKTTEKDITSKINTPINEESIPFTNKSASSIGKIVPSTIKSVLSSIKSVQPISKTSTSQSSNKTSNTITSKSNNQATNKANSQPSNKTKNGSTSKSSSQSGSKTSNESISKSTNPPTEKTSSNTSTSKSTSKTSSQSTSKSNAQPSSKSSNKSINRSSTPSSSNKGSNPSSSKMNSQSNSKPNNQSRSKSTSGHSSQKSDNQQTKELDKRKKELLGSSSEEERKIRPTKKLRRKSSSDMPDNNEPRGNASRSRRYDMPVDPNEPIYCFCRDVSYGDMVACDDQECSIEWFHFECVGITSNPKGKWYCKKCVLKHKKK